MERHRAGGGWTAPQPHTACWAQSTGKSAVMRRSSCPFLPSPAQQQPQPSCSPPPPPPPARAPGASSAPSAPRCAEIQTPSSSWGTTPGGPRWSRAGRKIKGEKKKDRRTCGKLELGDTKRRRSQSIAQVGAAGNGVARGRGMGTRLLRASHLLELLEEGHAGLGAL